VWVADIIPFVWDGISGLHIMLCFNKPCELTAQSIGSDGRQLDRFEPDM